MASAECGRPSALGVCTCMGCAQSARVHRLRCKGRVFAMDGWIDAPAIALCEGWSAQCVARQVEAALAKRAIAPCSTVQLVGAAGLGFRLLLAVGPGVVPSY